MTPMLTLIELCEIKGITNVREAMQLAAKVTAENPNEMNLIRQEVIRLNVCGDDELSHIKKIILNRPAWSNHG